MAKSDSVYICQQCGSEFAKWAGKCMNCGEWNSLVETKRFARAGERKSGRSGVKADPKDVSALKDIKTKSESRIQTGVKEFDKSLGGGLVAGQVSLVAGEPGIGKSTILLQIAQNLQNVLYVSGEESLSQIKLRADRLKVTSEDIKFLSETNIDTVLSTAEQQITKTDLRLIIIDSVQTMYTEDLSGIPGSVGQVRECSLRLIRLAKQENIPVILVGHVTKDGTVAGPSTLMHMVDTVLWFEGDKRADLRLVRVMKNRFGSTDEIALFVMSEKGLVSVSENDELLLDEDRLKDVPGSVTACIMEGSRTMLAEVQSLVIPTKLNIPRRVVQGIDPKRVEMILAVLTKHCNLKFYEADVFVNVVGGMKIKDPSLDLAVALALASSIKNKKVSSKLVAFGEVGLLGDVRPPSQFKKYAKHISNHKLSPVKATGKRISKILSEVFK